MDVKLIAPVLKAAFLHRRRVAAVEKVRSKGCAGNRSGVAGGVGVSAPRTCVVRRSRRRSALRTRRQSRPGRAQTAPHRQAPRTTDFYCQQPPAPVPPHHQCRPWWVDQGLPLVSDCSVPAGKSPNPILRILGERIRERRLSLGLSQERLAELAAIHRTYVPGIESGQRAVTVIVLMRLAEALGGDASELLTGLRLTPDEGEAGTR